jgi:hypothetical protein
MTRILVTVEAIVRRGRWCRKRRARSRVGGEPNPASPQLARPLYPEITGRENLPDVSELEPIEPYPFEGLPDPIDPVDPVDPDDGGIRGGGSGDLPRGDRPLKSASETAQLLTPNEDEEEKPVPEGEPEGRVMFAGGRGAAQEADLGRRRPFEGAAEAVLGTSARP